MTIIIKNKDTMIFDDFIFRCCVGKGGFTKSKIEGDKKTPIGKFKLDCLYFRKDRMIKPETNLNILEIKKNMGWCDDESSSDYYNKIINIKTNLKHEKLYLLYTYKIQLEKIQIGQRKCYFYSFNKKL